MVAAMMMTVMAVMSITITITSTTGQPHLHMALESRLVRNLRASIQRVGDGNAGVSSGYYMRISQRVDVLQDDAGHAKIPNGAADDDLVQGVTFGGECGLRRFLKRRGWTT